MTTLRINWWLACLCLVVPGRMGVWAEGQADHPHPIGVWADGPFEVSVAFDRPLDESVAKAAVGRVIPFEEAGAGDGAGDRDSDEGDPGRQGRLRIAAARLGDGGRTLRLVTDPHPRLADYALHLARVRGPGQPEPGEAIDLRYDLGGVEVEWDEGKEDGADPTWSSWWPELDPERVRQSTRGSVEHERLLEYLSRPGRLVLGTLLKLPEGRFTLRLVSGGPIEALVNGEEARAVDEPGGGQRVEYPIDSNGEPIDLLVTIRTGNGKAPTTLRATVLREADGAEFRLNDHHLLLPWVPTPPPAPAEDPAFPPTMAGGDPSRGEEVFFGEQARCSSCHAIGGKGGKVGPDLGRQFDRSPAQVYRDLADPGATIHPDFVAYTVALKDGRVLVGIVRAEGADAIVVTDTDAKSTTVRRDEIEEFRPSATSIMPVGLVGTLGEGPLRDLLAFLTQVPGASR